MDSAAEGRPLAIFGRPMAMVFTVENSFLVLFFHFFGVCRKANSVRRSVSPALFPLFGVHAGKWICMRRRVSPVFSFQIRIRCRNAMAVDLYAQERVPGGRVCFF